MKSVKNKLIVNNVIGVKSRDIKMFFERWLLFLEPIHKLTDRQQEVFVAFLMEWFELSKKINDDDLINKTLLSLETRNKIKDSMGLSPQNFKLIMDGYKKKNVLIEENGVLKFNKKIMPNIKDGQKDLKLLIMFTI